MSTTTKHKRVGKVKWWRVADYEGYGPGVCVQHIEGDHEGAYIVFFPDGFIMDVVRALKQARRAALPVTGWLVKVYTHASHVWVSRGAHCEPKRVHARVFDTREQARTDVVEARADVARLTAERDEARTGLQWMVERAADGGGKLDGYRELGAKVAAAETERDQARAQRESFREKAEHRHWMSGGWKRLAQKHRADVARLIVQNDKTPAQREPVLYTCKHCGLFHVGQPRSLDHQPQRHGLAEGERPRLARTRRRPPRCHVRLGA